MITARYHKPCSATSVYECGAAIHSIGLGQREVLQLMQPVQGIPCGWLHHERISKPSIHVYTGIGSTATLTSSSTTTTITTTTFAL